MRLEESFEVDAPVEEVWHALIDVQRVAPCLPGAEITEVGEQGTYRGNFQVKLGPTTAAYRGTLKLESLDEAARAATMSANGQDKRGQGGAKATIVSKVTEGEGGVTRVHVDTDFTITGRLARFGRGGMIQDISKRLLGDFAACLQEELKGPGTVDRTEHTGDPPVEARSARAAPAVPGEGTSRFDATAEPTARPTVSKPEQPVGQGARTPARDNRPVPGLSLFLSVVRDRIRRFLSRRRGGGGG